MLDFASCQNFGNDDFRTSNIKVSNLLKMMTQCDIPVKNKNTHFITFSANDLIINTVQQITCFACYCLCSNKPEKDTKNKAGPFQ